MESEQYFEGKGAYYLGKPVEANPYPSGSKPRLDWDRGWRKARLEAEGKGEL